MKQGWEIKKLGEVVNIINGRNQTAVISESGQYPIYGSAGNLMGYATDYLCEEGTTIIGRKGNISNPIYIEEKFWNVDTAFGLYPKNGYEPKFINYLCQTIDFKSRNRGTTIPSLVKSDLLSIDVPFISFLPEQQRIVSILDEAFAAIAKAKANAEQNLKNAKELFESYLQGVFEKKGDGWEEKTLGEIAFVKSGGTPSRHKTEYWNGDIAWYSSGELNDLYTTNPERHINELAIENSNAKLFPKGSLLIGMYDTAALKMSILDRDGTFNQAIAGVKPNPKIDLIFILHAINAIKPEILNLRRGVRQKNLSLEKIKNIPIAFPPLKAQQTIVRQLDALRAETQKLEAVYQKKIDDLEELKKSILQKAFAGELRGGEPVELKTKKSRRDDKIIENKINQTKPNPEGVI